MIGNDIVDLTLARKESRWQRNGFLDKLFTEKEKILIYNSLNPETMVWNLWSRKEAAYKIYNRKTQIRTFNPKQLECFDVTNYDGIVFGEVVCETYVYFTKTMLFDDCIHTIAVDDKSNFNHLQFLESTNNICKKDGIPAYFDAERQVYKPVSISHHGKFRAIVSIT
jgi:hypothetical protein